MLHAVKLDPSPRPVSLREAEPASGAGAQNFAGFLAQASAAPAPSAAVPPQTERPRPGTEPPLDGKTDAGPELESSGLSVTIQTGQGSQEHKAEVAEDPTKVQERATQGDPLTPLSGEAQCPAAPVPMLAAAASPSPAPALPLAADPTSTSETSAVAATNPQADAQPMALGTPPSNNQHSPRVPGKSEPEPSVSPSSQPLPQAKTQASEPRRIPGPTPVEPQPSVPPSAPTSSENKARPIPAPSVAPATLPASTPPAPSAVPAAETPLPDRSLPTRAAPVAPMPAPQPEKTAAIPEVVLAASPTPVGPTFPTNAPAATSPALPVATAQWALAQAAPGVPLRFTFSEGVPEDATSTPGPTLPALTELLSVPRPKMDVPLPSDRAFRAMIGTATRTETPSNTTPVPLSTSPVQPLAAVTESEQTIPASEVTPANLPTAALPVTQTRVGDPTPSLTLPEPTFVAMIPTRPAPENQPMAVTILQSAFPTAVSPQTKPKDTELPIPVLTDALAPSLDSAPPKSVPTVIAEPLPKALLTGSWPASPAISTEPALRGIALALPQSADPATSANLPVAQSLPTTGLDLPTSKTLSAAFANLNVPQSETRPEAPRFSLPLPVPSPAETLGTTKVSVEPARSAHQEARPAPPPAREPASASPPPTPRTGTPEPAPTRVLAMTEAATVGAKTSLAGETSFALHGSAATAGWSPVGLTPAVHGMESAPTALPNTTFVQVEAGIHWLIKNQEKGAEIQLNPESLGRVVIKIVVEGGEVHARLWAAEPSTVTLLQNQKASLEVSLQQQGLSLGSFDLHQGRRGNDTPTAPQHAVIDSGAKFADSLIGKQEVPTRPLPLLDGTRLIEVFA